MQLVKSKIGEQRTNQRFILLEGLCNANKLQNASEKLQLRFMDEYFQIEKSLGEVFGVISLQETEEDSHFTVEAGNFEEPVEEEVKEEAPKAEGEGEDEPAADGDEEAKKPAWDAKKFRWSITNGRSKNLPQLFRDYLGNKCNSEVKNWRSLHCDTTRDAITKALDEFCDRLTAKDNTMMIYQQVIFNSDE